MNAAPYFFFLFFLIANVIALPGVRQYLCDRSGCKRSCLCDYNQCLRNVQNWSSGNSMLNGSCQRTYECGTC